MFVRFTELPVVDQNRAVQFYTEKLGFRVAQDRSYDDGWRWITLEIPGARTQILLTRRSDGDVREAVPSLVLTVDDVISKYHELKEKGVTFTTNPTAAPWDNSEMYAVMQDSEGNLVMLGTPSESTNSNS